MFRSLFRSFKLKFNNVNLYACMKSILPEGKFIPHQDHQSSLQSGLLSKMKMWDCLPIFFTELESAAAPIVPISNYFHGIHRH